MQVKEGSQKTGSESQRGGILAKFMTKIKENGGLDRKELSV